MADPYEQHPKPELLTELSGAVSRASGHETWKIWRETARRNRRYLWGVEGEGEPGKVNANLVYATVHSLMQHVYARNPEVSCSPSAAANLEQEPWVRPFAKTMETILNRQMREAGLKDAAKNAVRSVFSAALGWVKVTYQRDLHRDPLIIRRMNDTQDEILRVESLARGLDDPSKGGEQEATLAKLGELLGALALKAEVTVSEGLAIDSLRVEDLVFPPEAIQSIDQYRRLPWIDQKLWMCREEAEELFKRKIPRATVYPSRDDLSAQDRPASSTPGKGLDLLCIHETWWRRQLNVYTWAEGGDCWLREPYAPPRLGRQWYPYFPLAFYLVDGRLRPLTLVEMLRDLQDEYGRARTQQSEHRRISIPHWVTDRTTDRTSIEKWEVAGIGDVIVVDAQGRPVREVFMPAEPPPYNPQIYDTVPIRVDFDQISGLSDAQRGAVLRAKTATEAEIQQTGMASRIAEMQDAVEDWIQNISTYSSDVLLQELTAEQASALAGQDALWVQLDKDRAFNLIQIEVRAGTSGKPDERRRQEIWIQLMPILQQLLGAIQQARMTGIPGADTTWVALARETLRRFDERLDLEELLPPPPPPGAAMPAAQPPASQPYPGVPTS